MADGYNARAKPQGTMTIQIKCPNCNTKIYVDGNKARKYACPACGKDL